MDTYNLHHEHFMFEQLLELLRQEGWTIGIDHYLRIQLLLSKIGEDCTLSELRTLLCPLFATDESQQEHFYHVFDAYFMLHRAIDAQVSLSTASSANSFIDTTSNRIYKRISKKLISIFRWQYILAGLVLLGILFALSNNKKIQHSILLITEAGNSQPPNTYPSDLTYVLRWLAAIGPIAMFSLYEFYRYNHRRGILRNQFSAPPSYILSFTPRSSHKRIFESESFYAAARLLHLRQTTEAQQLDINATVASTISSVGFPTLRFKPFSKLPEHLVLIERSSQYDHQAQLFYELTKALVREGVIITCYFYDGDPRICFPFPVGENSKQVAFKEDITPRKVGEGVHLIDLLQIYSEHRLIIFGDCDKLVEPISGELMKWANVFSLCQDRAILTPQAPSLWGRRELSLANYFVVLPASSEGLKSLVDYFEMRESLSFGAWSYGEVSTPPQDSNSPNFIRELRTYLGEEVFQWLCACAIFPRLQWDITINIGSISCMGTNLITEENILRLSRLPWFRTGYIPDDLRELLVRELHPDKSQEIQRTTITWLDSPTLSVDDLRINPNTLNIAISNWFYRRNQKRFIRYLHMFLRLKQRRVLRDHICLDFLDTTFNSLLDPIMPRKLLTFFYPKGNPSLRMRFSLRLSITVLAACILWLAAPNIAGAIKSRPDAPRNVPPQSSPTPTTSATPLPTVTPSDVTSPTNTPVSTPSPILIASPIQMPPSVRGVICPNISVAGSNLTQGSDSTFQYTLTAKVTGGRTIQAPSYTWSLQYNGRPAAGSQGNIISGQGTSSIVVGFPEDVGNSKRLVAKVRVTGFDSTCSTTASATLSLNNNPLRETKPCECGSCAGLICCPNPGFCVSCGACGSVCCPDNPD